MENEKLRDQVARSGMTRKQLSDKAGVSLWTIQQAITRGYQPSMRIAYRIAKALSADLAEIGLHKSKG